MDINSCYSQHCFFTNALAAFAALKVGLEVSLVTKCTVFLLAELVLAVDAIGFIASLVDTVGSELPPTFG